MKQMGLEIALAGRAKSCNFSKAHALTAPRLLGCAIYLSLLVFLSRNYKNVSIALLSGQANVLLCFQLLSQDVKGLQPATDPSRVIRKTQQNLFEFVLHNYKTVSFYFIENEMLSFAFNLAGGYGQTLVTTNRILKQARRTASIFNYFYLQLYYTFLLISWCLVLCSAMLKLLTRNYIFDTTQQKTLKLFLIKFTVTYTQIFHLK